MYNTKSAAAQPIQNKQITLRLLSNQIILDNLSITSEACSTVINIPPYLTGATPTQRKSLNCGLYSKSKI